MSFHLQPCLFVTALHFGKEIKRKRWVDQEVNHPDERHLVVPLATVSFRYRFAFR